MLEFFPERTVAVSILGFSVHWYGILYLAAFLIASVLLPRLQKYRGLTLSQETWSSILTAAILGVIIGGRLGYVFFYAPAYFLIHPLDVFAVWQGGMAFHGGFIGVIVALGYLMRGWSTDQVLKVADVIVVPVAIGLALGRIGNFINGEIYGPVTTLPWAVTFPGVEGARHPTQLYACAKDLFIASMCYLVLRKQHWAVGRTAALFAMLYGVLRFCIEWLRVQDVPPTVIAGLTLTRGQLLTIPVFVAGVLLWWWAGQRAKTSGGATHKGRTSR